jgi:hypothetical protein
MVGENKVQKVQNQGDGVNNWLACFHGGNDDHGESKNHGVKWWLLDWFTGVLLIEPWVFNPKKSASFLHISQRVLLDDRSLGRSCKVQYLKLQGAGAHLDVVCVGAQQAY